MDTISIVDTSMSTDNLGDEIIMDAVNSVVWELFPNAYIYRVPSHEGLSTRTHKFLRESRLCFIGGTNLLSSRITPLTLWRMGMDDAREYGLTNTVCLGTGWNDYMPAPTPSTAALLKTALSPKLIHSARDSYTRDHLTALGLKSIATSCPTTWSLTPEHCATIPSRRAEAVVFTLSAWRPDPVADRAFVEVLRRHYKRVYFFPQMQPDMQYFQSFGWEDIGTTPPTTEGYTAFLENEDIDFVGTRLHGGIRALQKKRRALVLSIDNRAAEISKDTGLPVVARTDTAAIENWIEADAPTAIKLPVEAIQSWKAQFSSQNLDQLGCLEPRKEAIERVDLGRKSISKRVEVAKSAVKSILRPQ